MARRRNKPQNKANQEKEIGVDQLIEIVDRKLPSGAKEEVKKSIYLRQEIVEMKGLMPAHMLEEFNSVAPDGANRVLTILEEQIKHRQEIELVHVTSTSKQSERGQIFGIVSFLAALGASIYLVGLGHTLEGIGTLFAVLLAIGGIYLKTKKN